MKLGQWVNFNSPGNAPRLNMAGMAYVAFWLFLVCGKLALMYGVWRLAKIQGRSPWLPFIASIFCASIVFLALFIKGRTERTEAIGEPIHQSVSPWIQTDPLPKLESHGHGMLRTL